MIYRKPKTRQLKATGARCSIAAAWWWPLSHRQERPVIRVIGHCIRAYDFADTAGNTGNYYFVDGASATIRKVTPSGVIKYDRRQRHSPYVCDGVGLLSAQLGFVYQLAADGSQVDEPSLQALRRRRQQKQC